jgi:hypothetical protein
VAGFVEGEGCFDVIITKKNGPTGHSVTLRFRVAQHSRDTQLLTLLKKYFEAGILSQSNQQPLAIFTLTKFSDITEKVIPFFELYPLNGMKKLDYLD